MGLKTKDKKTEKAEKDVQQKMFIPNPRFISAVAIEHQALFLDDTGQLWFFAEDEQNGGSKDEFRKFPMNFNHDWTPPED